MVVVTVKPPGREEYALTIDGQPRLASQAGIGYADATIPCELDDEQRLSVLGARVRCHGTTGIVWQGRVIRRPGRGEPMLAQGWGWCLKNGRREALYCDTRTSVWKERVWSNRQSDIMPSYDSTGLQFGYRAGSVIASGARNGLWREIPEADGCRVTFDWARPSTATGLALYSNDTPDTAAGFIDATEEWAIAAGSGDLSGSATVDITTDGVKYLMFTALLDTGLTQTGTGSTITNLKVYGVEGMTTITTHSLLDDIIANEVGTDDLPSGAQYLAWISADATDLEGTWFDSCSASDKIARLQTFSAYDFGFYSELVAGVPYVVPHWTARSTTPDYFIRLGDADGFNLDESTLDELSSVTRVRYSLADGTPAYVDVPDTDTAHPLVRLGITRYRDVTAATSSPTTAAAVGALANADFGREQVKGSVTTRSVLTSTGAPAYLPDIRPGQMARVTGQTLGDGARDCIIRRVECVGDAVASIQLDNAPYRLDVMLAELARR